MTSPFGQSEPTARSVLAAVPSRADRAAIGRAAREQAPLDALADWDPAGRRDHALSIVVGQNASRLASLIPIRMARMAISPWTYYRGAAAVMAADLAGSANTGLAVQLCGDAHVLNFGLWATPERQLSFDLRDFDETLRGPFEWDVKRFLASLVVLARDNGLSHATARRAVRSGLRSYRERMAHYAAAGVLEIWYDLVTAAELLQVFEPEERERVSARLDKRAPAPHERRGRAEVDRGGRRTHPDRRGPADSGAARRQGRREDSAALAGEIVAGLPRQPSVRAALPVGPVHVRRRGSAGRRRGQRRHAGVLGPPGGPRSRRSPVPADQAGRPVGVRAVPRTKSVPQPRAAGDHGQATHPGRERHLRRVDERAGVWTSTSASSGT